MSYELQRFSCFIDHGLRQGVKSSVVKSIEKRYSLPTVDY